MVVQPRYSPSKIPFVHWRGFCATNIMFGVWGISSRACTHKPTVNPAHRSLQAPHRRGAARARRGRATPPGEGHEGNTVILHRQRVSSGEIHVPEARQVVGDHEVAIEPDGPGHGRRQKPGNQKPVVGRDRILPQSGSPASVSGFAVRNCRETRSRRNDLIRSSRFRSLIPPCKMCTSSKRSEPRLAITDWSMTARCWT